MTSDAPQGRGGSRAETLKARARTRYPVFVCSLLLAAALTITGLSGFAGSSGVWFSGFMWSIGGIALAALTLLIGLRHFRLGIHADQMGVTISGLVSGRVIAWADVAGIDVQRADPDAWSPTYHVLAFRLADGEVVIAPAPGGGIKPGQHLHILRERLQALRDAARPPTPPPPYAPPADTPPPVPGHPQAGTPDGSHDAVQDTAPVEHGTQHQREVSPWPQDDPAEETPA